MANTERDRKVTAALESAGWEVVRVWEHESVDEASVRIQRLVSERREIRA